MQISIFTFMIIILIFGVFLISMTTSISNNITDKCRSQVATHINILMGVGSFLTGFSLTYMICGGCYNFMDEESEYTNILIGLLFAIVMLCLVSSAVIASKCPKARNYTGAILGITVFITILIISSGFYKLYKEYKGKPVSGKSGQVELGSIGKQNLRFRRID